VNLEQLFEMPRGEQLVTRIRRAFAEKLKKSFGQTDQEALVNSTSFFPDGMSEQEVIAAAKESGIELNGNSDLESDIEKYRQSGEPPVFTARGNKMSNPAIDVKDVDELDQEMGQQFGDLEKAVSSKELPDGVKLYPDSSDISKGTLVNLNNKMFMKNIKEGFYDDVAVLGGMLMGIITDKGWTKIFPKQVNSLSALTETSYNVAQDWIDHANKRKGTYEHLNVHGIELYIPEPILADELATKVLATVAQKYPELAPHTKKAQTESINESINTHDKLVATVANYLYAKHPELFTKHGDGYVMSVVDDVVSKTEDLEDPLQDIKAFALEIMDALGADRTNEARAQVKTDWRGHHLVNADGAVVQTYPKDADNLEVARERLYRDHRRLNTMTKKNEDLDAAFDAALNTLNESVNINTTTSSEGDDTVTVTATGEDAYELVNILKAAGIPHDKAEQYAPAPCDAAIAMPMEEEYANEPEEDVMNGDIDHMNTQSGGLNRRKMQQKYANPPGDNPLAESEDLLRGLWDLYKEAK
jgi:hypothetical protein